MKNPRVAGSRLEARALLIGHGRLMNESWLIGLGLLSLPVSGKQSSAHEEIKMALL